MANSIKTIAELESSLLSIQKKVEDKGFRARIYYNISRFIWSAINLYVSVDITTLDGKGESSCDTSSGIPFIIGSISRV